MNRTFLYYSSLTNWDRVKTLALIVGLIGLTSCQSIPTNAQPGNFPASRTLTVSGKGTINIPTTMTAVRLGVEIQGKTAQIVQQQVAKRSQSVLELLKSSNVEKLETTGINLNPNYSYKDGKQTINGYSGSNIVSFRINTEKSGTLLDDAIKAGATKIEGISFIASDEALAQAQQQAIKKASDDAKKQAASALTALNLKQQEVIGVQINNATSPMPFTYSNPAALSQVAENAKTPVVGGEQKVQQTVTLQIRY